MQPYLLPYDNYFKLINRSDKFVILNDVNFPKKKYVNKNFFLNSGRLDWVIPLKKISQNKLISEHFIFEPINSKKKLHTSFVKYFKKTKYFDENSEFLESIFEVQHNRIDLFIYHVTKILCNYFGISTKISLSSELNITEKNEHKIIAICKKFNASSYLNLPGGKDIYNDNLFNENGIMLKFLDYSKNNYSIIDGLFHYGKEQIIRNIE